VKCLSHDCASDAVVRWDWPGHVGPLFSCEPCASRAQHVARALGLELRFDAAETAALESVYRLAGMDALIEACVHMGLHVADARALAIRLDQRTYSRDVVALKDYATQRPGVSFVDVDAELAALLKGGR
jgi:hypothetical protein